MNTEINQLIEYLRLKRRTDELEKNKEPNNTVTLTILNTDFSYTVTKNQFENFSLFERIFHQLENLSTENMYFFINTITANEKEYFLRRIISNNQNNPVYEYKKINEDIWFQPNTENFEAVKIDCGIYYYFYDTTNNHVVISSKNIDEILVTTDVFKYNPDDIAHINNGEYMFDYEDHAGGSLLTSFLKTFVAETSLLSQKRVAFTKKTDRKSINLVPFINQAGHPLQIIFPYIIKQKNSDGKYNYFFQNCLVFKFNFIGTYLEFLNRIIFYDTPDFLDYCESRVRQTFKKNYISILQQSFSNVNSSNYRDILINLKYVPQSCYKYIPKVSLWEILEMTINNNTINNRIAMNEEDLILLLLKAIAEQEKPNRFLTELLVKRNSNKTSYFEVLFNKINNGNFIAYISFLNEIWKKSSFTNPEYNGFDAYNEAIKAKELVSPLFLPYESNKNLGFYSSNTSMDFNANDNKLWIKTRFETGKYETKMRPGLKTDNLVPTPVQIINEYWYHPFSPIFAVNAEKQETEIKLDTIIPAFLLKANGDKQFWSNVVTSGEYALDVITTLSGVGNLAKFRYLTKFATKASKLRFVSQAGKNIATAKKAVTGFAAAIEISSGAVSALFKLTEIRETDLGKKILEYLFWVELLSLSGELTVAIHNGLRKSARKLVEKPEDAAKLEKQLDDLAENGQLSRKQADEVVEHLDEVADLDNLGKVSGRGRRLGQKLSKSALNDLVNYLKKEGVAFEIFPEKGAFEIKDFIGSDGKNLIMQKSTQAAFVYTNKSSKFCVREGVTVFEFLHEFMHFKHSRKLGLEKYHSLGGYGTPGELVKEKLVFDKMIEYKDFLTKKELIRSLEYLNDDIYQIRGIDPISFDFDINKIPEVRKEIDIKQLFHLK